MGSLEDYCFEVPLENSCNYEYNNKNLETSIQEATLKDNDCSIVETEDLQNPKHISRVYSLNEDYNKKTDQNVDQNHTEINLVSTPIVIDVDLEKDPDCTVIDDISSDEDISRKSRRLPHNKTVNFYDQIYKENQLFTQLIEKCLDMENSAGMLRVINRTLIPFYRNASDEFKKSDTFQKVLSQKMIKLDTDPDKKFSHIKGLCEILKASKEKKRVSLVTLEKNLNGKFSNRTRFVSNSTRAKRKKIDIINLDDYDDKINCNSNTDITISDVQIASEKSSTSLQVVNVNDAHVEINDSDIEINEQNGNDDDDVILIDGNVYSNKENRNGTRNNEETVEMEFDKRRKEISNLNNNEPHEPAEVGLSIEVKSDNANKASEPNNLPRPAVDDILIPRKYSMQQHIENLEKSIAIYSNMIRELEEREVGSENFDSLNSPYIQSEVYKSKVLALYKELCRLTGTNSVKRHKVRLKVAPGHPVGPIKCLEEFINENIDPDGNPPFPDIHDVVNCVRSANEQYQMGWSKKQIEDEARALFIHYGQTVQKRRQKREWRHLLTYIKEEAPDPADEDSALQARLLENAKVAKKNEDELFDRYAQMETPATIPNPGLILDVQNTHESKDGDSGSTPMHSVTTHTVNNSNNDSTTINNDAESNHGNITNDVIYDPSSASDQQQTGNDLNQLNVINQTAQSLLGILTTMGHNFVVHFSNPEHSKSNTTSIDPNLPICSSIDNANPNFEIIVKDTHNNIVTLTPSTDGKLIAGNSSTAIQVNEVTTNLDDITLIPNKNDTVDKVENSEVRSSSEYESCKDQSDNAGTSQTDLKEVIVKREPLDIPRMLEELGDNYTATIFDIEDPFMVIEISDSSDSETEDETDVH